MESANSTKSTAAQSSRWEEIVIEIPLQIAAEVPEWKWGNVMPDPNDPNGMAEFYDKVLRDMENQGFDIMDYQTDDSEIKQWLCEL